MADLIKKKIIEYPLLNWDDIPNDCIIEYKGKEYSKDDFTKNLSGKSTGSSTKGDKPSLGASMRHFFDAVRDNKTGDDSADKKLELYQRHYDINEIKTKVQEYHKKLTSDVNTNPKSRKGWSKDKVNSANSYLHKRGLIEKVGF